MTNHIEQLRALVKKWRKDCEPCRLTTKSDAYIQCANELEAALSGARLESPRCVAADVVTDAMDDAEWIHVSDFERMLAVRIEAALNVKSVAADVVSEKDSIEKIVADMRAQPFSKVSMDIVDTWGYRLIELSRACKGEG